MTRGGAGGWTRDRFQWVYLGDPKMWALTPMQRYALRCGLITPREARELYDLVVAHARATMPWLTGAA